MLINVDRSNPQLRDEDEMEMRDSRICSCRGSESSSGGSGGGGYGGLTLGVEVRLEARLKASGPVSQTGWLCSSAVGEDMYYAT